MTTPYCDDSVLESDTGPVNIEINWEPNTIKLHWYEDSESLTRMTVASESQECTYDGILIPPIVPTKTGYTFKGWRVRGLPAGYTRLQYIESSGTQWIDTGFTVGAGTAVVAVIEGHGDKGVVFSWDQDWTGTYIKELDNKFCAAGQCFGPSNIKTTVSSSWVGTSGNVTQTVVIDGVSKSYTCSRWYRPLNIFKGYNWGHSDSFWAGKVYVFEMYQNDSLVRELIPARNSNNVVGMYDMVSKAFFTNVGSGSFIAGPAIQ